MNNLPLELVEKLCSLLEQEGVVYCHWKSNAALDRSAAGENDLDLLVSRAEAQRFIEILSRLGFKEAFAPRDQQLPGVLDYYGYDRQADRFVHVHLHFQLVLGHDLYKNYHLPLEEPFLQTTLRSGLLKIPIPELEWILLVIRMMIKHATWGAYLLRHTGLSASERQELEYLRARINPARVDELLAQYLPCVSPQLFRSCEQVLQPGWSVGSRVRTGNRLQRSLAAHTRRALLPVLLIQLWRRYFVGRLRRFSGKKPKPRPANGGLFIALVGGGGAGKSTEVDGLHKWLSQVFDVRKARLGAPRPSGLTTLVNWILRSTPGLYAKKEPLQSAQASNAGSFPGYRRLLREVCTARDRAMVYVKARRFANQGGLVIADCFPLPRVKHLDGPAEEKLTGSGTENWLVRQLLRLEKRYDAPVLLPELLVVFRVDPHLAVRQKREDASAAVRTGLDDAWEFNGQQAPAYVIDASQPEEQILSELKKKVWSVI